MDENKEEDIKGKNNRDELIPSDSYSKELGTDLDDETPDKPKGIPLHTKILSGLVIGVIGGLTVNLSLGGENPNVTWFVENFTRPIGQLFLNLLLMIVVPLVFSSLVVGGCRYRRYSQAWQNRRKIFYLYINNLRHFSCHWTYLGKSHPAR